MLSKEEQSKILDSVKQKNIKNTLEEDIALIEATEAALLAKVEGELDRKIKHELDKPLFANNSSGGLVEIRLTEITKEWIIQLFTPQLLKDKEEIERLEKEANQKDNHAVEAIQQATDKERERIANYLTSKPINHKYNVREIYEIEIDNIRNGQALEGKHE